MVIGRSSQPIAGGGIEHRTGEKTEADGYEKDIEHGNLTIGTIANH